MLRQYTTRKLFAVLWNSSICPWNMTHWSEKKKKKLGLSIADRAVTAVRMKITVVTASWCFISRRSRLLSIMHKQHTMTVKVPLPFQCLKSAAVLHWNVCHSYSISTPIVFLYTSWCVYLYTKWNIGQCDNIYCCTGQYSISIQPEQWPLSQYIPTYATNWDTGQCDVWSTSNNGHSHSISQHITNWDNCRCDNAATRNEPLGKKSQILL